MEKLRYIHRNPVTRGLVGQPQDWQGSSFRHHATGLEGVVEIESDWTAQKRETMGIRPTIRSGPVCRFPPWQSQDGAPQFAVGRVTRQTFAGVGAVFQSNGIESDEI